MYMKITDGDIEVTVSCEGHCVLSGLEQMVGSRPGISTFD